MAKNISDVLKGGGGSGAGIKGTWDVTPITSTTLSATDIVNLTWDSVTATATVDWSALPPAQNEVPVAGAAILSATVGELTIDQVKRLAIKGNANFFNVAQGAALMSFAVVPATMTAEQLRQFFINFVLDVGGAPTTPIIQTLIQQIPGDGSGGLAMTSLSVDGGVQSAQSFAGYLTEAFSSDHWATVFITRKQPGGAGTSTEINFVEAIFKADGTLVGFGNADNVNNNPVIPPNSKLAVAALYMPNNGVYETFGAQVNLLDIPDTITLPVDFGTTPSAGQTSFNGVTQGDIDLIFSNPATDIASIGYPPFPAGTKKNDMWRARNTTPSVPSVPYGTLVQNDDIVVVDNVNPGNEAIRVDVMSTYLEQALLAPTAKAEEAMVKAGAAGLASGKATFFVRSTDSFLSNPLSLTAPNVFSTFAAAYEAAIALPKHIHKTIIIDNRSVNVRQTISVYAPTGGGSDVYYLAANNIQLSTTTHWQREARDKTELLSTDPGEQLVQTVLIKGLFDALHFDGGAFAVVGSGVWNNPTCVPISPSAPIGTPRGPRKALEIGDRTQLYLSPLAFLFDNWGYYFNSANPNNSLTIGKECSVLIYPDLSSASPVVSAGFLVFGEHIYEIDVGSGHYDTGRLNYFPAAYSSPYYGIHIRLGENSDFIIADGTAYLGSAATGQPGFLVSAPVRHGDISFGTIGTSGSYTTTSTVTYDGDAAGGTTVSAVSVENYAQFQAASSYTNNGSFQPDTLEFANKGIRIIDDINLQDGIDLQNKFGSNFIIYASHIEGVTKSDGTRPTFNLMNDGNWGNKGVLRFPGWTTIPTVVKNLVFRPQQIPNGNQGRIFAQNTSVNGVTFEDCDFDFTNSYVEYGGICESIMGAGDGGKPLIFRRCKFTTSVVKALQLYGSIGTVIFDECTFVNGASAPIGLSTANIFQYILFDNCKFVSNSNIWRLIDVGDAGNTSFSANAKIYFRNCRDTSGDLSVDLVAGDKISILDKIVILKDTDNAGKLSEVVLNTTVPGANGRNLSTPIPININHMNRKVLIDNTVNIANGNVFSPEAHLFALIDPYALILFSKYGTDVIEITLRTTSVVPATFVDNTTSQTLSVNGHAPVYVLVHPSFVDIDRDEVIDAVFQLPNGEDVVAIRLDATAEDSKIFIPTIRLERKSQRSDTNSGDSTDGAMSVVKLSTNRTKASCKTRTISTATDQLRWADVGTAIHVNHAAPTITLPQRNYGGDSPATLGMDRFMGRGFEFRTTAASTITLNAPTNHIIKSATNPAGVSSEVISVPAFSTIKVIYNEHGAHPNFWPTWAVYQ